MEFRSEKDMRHVQNCQNLVKLPNLPSLEPNHNLIWKKSLFARLLTSYDIIFVLWNNWKFCLTFLKFFIRAAQPNFSLFDIFLDNNETARNYLPECEKVYCCHADELYPPRWEFEIFRRLKLNQLNKEYLIFPFFMFLNFTFALYIAEKSAQNPSRRN